MPEGDVLPDRTSAVRFKQLTEACTEGGFRDSDETEVVSLWAHGEITRLRAENEMLRDCLDRIGDMTVNTLERAGATDEETR